MAQQQGTTMIVALLALVGAGCGTPPDPDTDPVDPGCDASTEVCNGVDDDCDGFVDNRPLDGVTGFRDDDGDGAGNAQAPLRACGLPAGYALDGDDCDDTDASVGAETAFYADEDGDGYGELAARVVACTRPDGYVSDATDCDDAASTVHPDAVEVCNGDDDDCDARADEDVALPFYADADGDGYGDASAVTSACEAPSGYVPDDTDCDDARSAVNPAVTEVCDGVDNDCDGLVDEGLPLCIDLVDADGDGEGAATDCDDTDARVYSGAPELCDNRRNDCTRNGWSAAAEAGLVTWFPDAGSAIDVTQAFTGTYALTGGLLQVCDGTYGVSLVASSPAATTVVGLHGPDSTVLMPANGSVLSMSDVLADVALDGLAFTGAATAPAIDVMAGKLMISASRVTGNALDGLRAGTPSARLAAGSSISLVDTDAGGNGGAGLSASCAASDGLTVTGGSFDGNGKGLVAEGCRVEIDGASFVSNAGVGLWIAGLPGPWSPSWLLPVETGTVRNALIADNRGGGLAARIVQLQVEASAISNNRAVDGAGILLGHAALALIDTAVSGNVASRFGGGFYATNSDQLRCVGSSATAGGFFGNTAASGGGGYVWDGSYANPSPPWLVSLSSCDFGVGPAANVGGDVVIDVRLPCTTHTCQSDLILGFGSGDEFTGCLAPYFGGTPSACP